LGHVVHVWKPHVTKVDRSYLDCSVYLYRSAQAAEEGEDSGGSGFLVSVPSEAHADRHHIFAVTNKHVVVRDDADETPRAQILRLTTLDRKSDVLDMSGRWIKSKSDDLAVTLLSTKDLEPYKYDSVPIDHFVTEDDLNRQFPNVYIGTPCFMVGRFLNAQGQQRNTPAVRFGDISIMSYDMTDPGDASLKGVFIVEMHSIGGFSGSPVFTYPHFAHEGGIKHQITQLLGVDRGHTQKKVYVRKGGEKTDRYFMMNTGGAIVIPAWRLLALLNEPKATASRREEDMRITAREQNPAWEPDSLEGEVSSRGPEPERLKIDREMDEAVADALKRGKPPRSRGKKGKKGA
jgi:hypothetical protein